MNIIVIGCGKVGRTITQYLSDENHSVTVIDEREDRIEEMINENDVQGVCGNGLLCSTLEEADVHHTYLVIATTDSDEVNMLCCMTARKLGARHSIARVRNPIYLQQSVFMRDELGFSMLINPEYQAAIEISRMLRFPSAINVESFAKGRVDLVEARIQYRSKLAGIPLSKIPKLCDAQVLICAVERRDHVYIPNGDFVLREDDRIHVAASQRDMNTFFRNTGMFRGAPQTVMIIGGGRIAYYLAHQLSEMNIKLKIIEIDANRCEELAEHFPKADIIHGDGTNQNLLEEEGMLQSDAVVALTGIDEENIVIAMFAKMKGASKVITKVNRPNLVQILESIGTESVVSPKDITANTILQYVRAKQNTKGNSVKTLYKLMGGRVEALEFVITQEQRGVGIPLRDLDLKEGILIAAIIRGNKVIFPNGNDAIHIGDSVLVVTTNRRLLDLRDILANR